MTVYKIVEGEIERMLRDARDGQALEADEAILVLEYLLELENRCDGCVL